MKKIMKASWIGISIALAIFIIIGIVFDLYYSGDFRMTRYSFSKMAIGAILVGLGFGAPSAIYGNEAVPYPLQVILHLGIGMAVLMAVSFAVGWIPASFGVVGTIGYIAADAAFVLLIWFGFYRHYQKEAAEMNKRIAEKQQ
jgi:hypothetical protein